MGRVRRGACSGPSRASTAALGVLLATLTVACGSSTGRIVVGSKNFSEQDILGEIIAQWVERTTSLQVERRLHLGGTFIAHRALRSGDIDLYPEYTGTALTAILERAPIDDPGTVFREVRAAYADEWDLEWMEPLGFQNTFAMLVRRATADSLGLASLSDLTVHAPKIRAGFGYEFMRREDGYAGLITRYGLEFAQMPLEMDLGLVYRAVAGGHVDLTAGNSTDGRIEALGLVQLADDLRFFPPYEAAIVVRRETLERHPGLDASLARLSGQIDTPTMRRLNRAVDLEGRSIVDVARVWVDTALAADPGANPEPISR